MCPVYVARAGDEGRGLLADPDEVAATEWTDWSAFSAAVLAGERDVSPWCRQQVADLVAALGRSWDGSRPVEAADPAMLPPAGRRGSWGQGSA
jgi:isopentenyl-diphosphate delta-isomerase